MQAQRRRIHRRRAASAHEPSEPRPLARRPSTVGELVTGALRVAVVAALVVLLLVGVVTLLGGDGGRAAAGRSTPAAVGSWPDDEARAFAVGFARAYATFGPGYESSHERLLEPYLSDDLRGRTLVQLPDRGPAQRVTGAVVSRAEPIGLDRALVTVALTIEQRTISTRYLTVPVRRQRRALVVDDLPAWSPPPAKAVVDEPSGEEVPSDDRTPIRGVLERFFPPFLAGRTDERRTVLAVVRARDRESHAAYTLRYRLALTKGADGRWLVADLNTTTGGPR